MSVYVVSAFRTIPSLPLEVCQLCAAGRPRACQTSMCHGCGCECIQGRIYLPLNVCQLRAAGICEVPRTAYVT
eukprot:1141087-Pelagomonas_calceolata.AAC.12